MCELDPSGTADPPLWERKGHISITEMNKGPWKITSTKEHYVWWRSTKKHASSKATERYMWPDRSRDTIGMVCQNEQYPWKQCTHWREKLNTEKSWATERKTLLTCSNWSDLLNDRHVNIDGFPSWPRHDKVIQYTQQDYPRFLSPKLNSPLQIRLTHLSFAQIIVRGFLHAGEQKKFQNFISFFGRWKKMLGSLRFVGVLGTRIHLGRTYKRN